MTGGVGRPLAASDIRSWSDSSLLAAVRTGDQKAFAEIAARHFAPVYRVVWRMTGGHADAEDLAQEAFVKLWADPSQLRQAGALKGWLMRVASNAALDRLRKPRLLALDRVPDIADSAAVPDKPLDRAEAARIIDRRIAALPDRQRLAVSLVHFEGLSNIEAAEIMEITVEAVESLLGRARRALRQSLSAEWRDILAGLAD